MKINFYILLILAFTINSCKINQKVFLKDKCLVTYYNENKILIISGQTKSEVNEKKSHWFYYGDWNFYDNNGKLVLIKKYINGELISEIKIKE